MGVFIEIWGFSKETPYIFIDFGRNRIVFSMNIVPCMQKPATFTWFKLSVMANPLIREYNKAKFRRITQNSQSHRKSPVYTLPLRIAESTVFATHISTKFAAKVYSTRYYYAVRMWLIILVRSERRPIPIDQSIVYTAKALGRCYS